MEEQFGQPIFSQQRVFMQQALAQAEIAAEQDEVPVGVVIVHNDQIIAKAYNQVELLKDPTAHAEMIAITQASNALACKWLYECVMYVTIEPCSMCAGAIVLARMKKVHFGASDPKTGACGSVINITQNNQLNHHVEVSGGVFEEECGGLMSHFFELKRKTKKSVQ